MDKSSIRSKRKARRKRQQLTSRLVWGGVALLLVAITGFMLWNGLRPLAGESVPLMPNSSQHIDPNAPPSYHTDPPTSGPHFASTLPAGFYEEADLSNLPQYPEGYLVHNLEHGHVILWYNCDLLDDAACDQLKAQLQEVVDSFNGTKVVAFPWNSIEVPLVMTSWARMQRFSEFDRDQVVRFVRTNRNQSPEPNAP